MYDTLRVFSYISTTGRVCFVIYSEKKREAMLLLYDLDGYKLDSAASISKNMKDKIEAAVKLIDEGENKKTTLRESTFLELLVVANKSEGQVRERLRSTKEIQ